MTYTESGSETYGLELNTDSLLPEEFTVGIATTTEQKIARIQVTSFVYTAKGYLKGISIKPLTSIEQLNQLVSAGPIESGIIVDNSDVNDFHENGIVFTYNDIPYYIDRFEQRAVPIVAVRKSKFDGSFEWLGSSRLIIRDGNKGIDLPSDGVTFDGDKEWHDENKKVIAEFSQLAVVDKNIAPYLFRSMVNYSRNNPSIGPRWTATIDSYVFNLLNTKYHFNLRNFDGACGIDYMGSRSIPTIIDYEKSISSALEGDDNSRSIAFIINGQDAGKLYKGK